jgi:hypothetical protein
MLTTVLGRAGAVSAVGLPVGNALALGLRGLLDRRLLRPEPV